MILRDKTVMVQDAGTNWSTGVHINSANISGNYEGTAGCITSTGRIILNSNSKDTASGSKNGIWCSDDNGATWTRSRTSPLNKQILDLCITDNGRILAMYASGLLCSDDNGSTWYDKNRSTLQIATGNTIAKMFKLSNNRILLTTTYATNTSNAKVYYCDNIDDTSPTFQDISTLAGNELRHVLKTKTGRIIAVSSRTGSSSTVTAYKGIWYSDDNGATWTRATDDYTYANGIMGSAELSSGKIILYNNNNTISYSDDNGLTWTRLTQQPLTVQSVLQNKTGIILIGTPDGVYSSRDGFIFKRILDKAGNTSMSITSSNDISITVIGEFSDGRILITRTRTNSNPYPTEALIGSAPVYETKDIYTNLPVTGKQVKEYVRQFKAYVQSLKQQ